MKKIAELLSALTFLISLQATSQTNTADDGFQLNTITTAVPFLNIAPDSRSGAMGDAGVAISPDVNALHWNPSKLAFAENEMELSLSYSPWLRKLVPDMNIAYLNGYKKLNDRSAVGGSLRYFSLGEITFTDNDATVLRLYSPSEFALDGTYAIKLSDSFSGGLSARFVYSNLTGSTNVGGADTKPGTSFAVDLSGYYVKDDLTIGDADAIFSAGFNISNVGSKMAYTNTSDRDFIPTNLRLGPALTYFVDDYNKLTFALDFNKLLVPTPPIYLIDSAGNPVFDPITQNFVIASGRDPNVGVASGIFGSFTDAPGNVTQDPSTGDVSIEKGSVFKEELREVNIGGGLEYWFQDQFALRGGYFYEHPSKGDRRFFTAGLGLKFKKLVFDASYLIASQNRSPLANTVRISLRLNFSKLEAAEGGEE